MVDEIKEREDLALDLLDKVIVQDLISQLLSDEVVDSGPIVLQQVRDVLSKAMARLDSLQVVPEFVEETAHPLPEKPRGREGDTYEQTLRLMERTRLISRGNGRIWEGGGYLWLPDGMRLKDNVFGKFTEKLDSEGYGPFQTPRVLPRAIIDGVIRGIVDLTKGTYWLAEVRDGELRESGRYANSTNDPVVNYHLGAALKTDKNAYPIKLYGRHQIIRSHSVTARPFFNSDENTDLLEAYSIQETSEDCEREFESIIAMMEDFFKELGISFLTVDQSMWGNKPVAKKVTSLQTYAAPAKGSVRLATIYMHDNTFAKVFDVYKKIGKKREHAHQVGFGFWEGLFLPFLDHLADKYGFCIPPKVAASQIVLLPHDEESEVKAIELAKKLGEHRVKIDTRYKKPIQKRLKSHLESGVPLRVTFKGNGQIRFSRRDTLKHAIVDSDEFVQAVPHLFESMSSNYSARSAEYSSKHLAETQDISQIDGLVASKNLVIFNHCGQDECAQKIEKTTPGEFLGYVRDFQINDCCIRCGKDANKKGLIGRRAPTP